MGARAARVSLGCICWQRLSAASRTRYAQPSRSPHRAPHLASYSAWCIPSCRAAPAMCEQAMQRCGCGLLPRVGAHGGTPKPEEARALLRAIWRHVLQLSADEAAALQDDAPFATYGGDSLLAVQALPPRCLWLHSLHLS